MRWIPVSLLLALLCSALAAQTTQPADAHVDLVTIGPGAEIFERFAHNAIRIQNPGEPPQYRDVAFNYGLFSFGGDFIYRFALGKMRYWMGGEDYPEMAGIYSQDNRSLWLQRLNLTGAQHEDLARFLWNNASPENRYYTYNYYNDNCSTRLRDALDGVLGGQIKSQTASVMTGRTYRYHTRRILAVNPVIYICVDFVLGHPGDNNLSRWDEMFLPQLMQEYLRDVHVTVDGKPEPLVLFERTASTSTRPPVLAAPPSVLPLFILAGVFTTTALLLLAWTSRRSLLIRIARNTLIIAWTLLAAIAGCTLTFFNLATDHWATYRNENLLQMPPIALMTLLLLPWALRTRNHAPRYPRVCKITAGLAVSTFALSLLGLVLKLLPAFYQDNWNIILWVLPVHAAVAMILTHAAWVRRPAAQ